MIDEYLKFATNLAREVGKILLKRRGERHNLVWKSQTDYKNEVDDICDSYIRQAIQKQYPRHNVCTEENITLEKNSNYTWVIDPLSGTVPYTSGVNDNFTVSIALLDGKEPVVGVIYVPAKNDLFYAAKGGGRSATNKKLKLKIFTIFAKCFWESILASASDMKESPIYKKCSDQMASIVSSPQDAIPFK